MDASSLGVQAKRKKLCDNHGMARLDGLCDLPDAVLYHILSFLSMKDVVGTSVLSKKWRYLWASVPNLDLHERDFHDRCFFMNFVDRALILRDRSSISAFSLTCNIRRDAYRINTWITAAARGNLVELSLNLSNPNEPFTLPLCISECTTLSKLELNLSVTLGSSLSGLSNLKHVSLEKVTFADARSVEKLFSSPLLEELSIKRCSWKHRGTIVIGAPKLLKLSIDDQYMEEPEDLVQYDRKVRIHSASLKYFRYKGRLINQYRLGGSALQLVEAEISICNLEGPPEDPIAIDLHDLLPALASVKSLTLTGNFLMGLASRSGFFQALPDFDELTKLKFDGAWSSSGSELLFDLLERSPKIRSLELIKEGDSDYDFDEDLYEPDFCKQLKSIKVSDFYVNETGSDLMLVRALLETSTALEELVLHYDGTMAEKESLSQTLMKLPRGLNCRIRILPPGEDCLGI